MINCFLRTFIRTFAQFCDLFFFFFTVLVGGHDVHALQVIKEVRELTKLDLKAAKDLVEGAPKVRIRCF